jgi:hypothetical protein
MVVAALEAKSTISLARMACKSESVAPTAWGCSDDGDETGPAIPKRFGRFRTRKAHTNTTQTKNARTQTISSMDYNSLASASAP